MLSHLLGFAFVIPLITLIYFAIPKDKRYLWLLLVSYGFYIYINAAYAGVLLLLTAIGYFGALKMQGDHKKLSAALCILSSLGILVFFKYFGVLYNGVNSILNIWRLQLAFDVNSLILPIGMSYYTLQSLGYAIDVYRGKAEPEKNFAKYALFVSFFPTVFSGPIQRSSTLLKQINQGTDFNYDQAKKGLLMIAFGLFEKILISNQLATITRTAYNEYQSLTGATILFILVLFGLQIYADFAGYSHIAIGIANVLGFSLEENFKQPYFSASFKDFWKRWHISLSLWLKDYVYISLGGNRKGKLRANINVLMTFLATSFWHGFTLNYCVYNLSLGLFVVLENLFRGTKEKLIQTFAIKTDCFSYKLFNIAFVFMCYNFLWVFFMPENMSVSMDMIRRIFCDFNLGLTLSNQLYFLDKPLLYQFLFIKLLVLFFVDLLHENNFSLSSWLKEQNVVFRWVCYLGIAVMLFVALFNNYGEDQDFLYIKF